MWRAAYTAPGLDDELLLEETGLGLLVLVVLAVPALQWLYHSYRFGAVAAHSYLAGIVVTVHSPLGDAKLLHFESELRASSHSLILSVALIIKVGEHIPIFNFLINELTL